MAIPQAKETLRQAKAALVRIKNARSVPQFESSYADFLNATRNITFVLQKQYNDDPDFKAWYPEKQEHMKNDALCKYFLEARNAIVKEGKLGLAYRMTIQTPFTSEKDILNRPKDAPLRLSSRGIFIVIDEGTGKEDIIPAEITPSKLQTQVTLENPPNSHNGTSIPLQTTTIEFCEMYFTYLKNLVEEWTEKLNKRND